MWPFSSINDSASSSNTTPTPSSASTDARVPSLPFETQGSPSQASSSPIPSASRYDAILRDEQQYQAVQYPTTEEVPGCMTLLDAFLSCHALIPEMKNFYRFGEPRNCSWRWQDFKYCLSLKSEDEEDRRQLWIKRRAEWWAKRRVERSSEDVWDMRKAPLENFPPLYVEEIPNETTL